MGGWWGLGEEVDKSDGSDSGKDVCMPPLVTNLPTNQNQLLCWLVRHVCEQGWNTCPEKEPRTGFGAHRALLWDVWG